MKSQLNRIILSFVVSLCFPQKYSRNKFYNCRGGYDMYDQRTRVLIVLHKTKWICHTNTVESDSLQ